MNSVKVGGRLAGPQWKLYEFSGSYMNSLDVSGSWWTSIKMISSKKRNEISKYNFKVFTALQNIYMALREWGCVRKSNIPWAKMFE